ncbi:MAG: discoidin domain-containing protein [Gemmatimonadota bacterium]|nr:discoidin domain-containing protein [Gemmatimonadota bacterium]
MTARMRTAFAIAIVLTASRAEAQQTRVIDDFSDISAWKAVPSDGVSLKIGSDAGEHGRAMRLDFDFHGGGGYAVAHRAVALEFPPNYEISFDIRGDAPSENVEVKFLDASGENVWWVNRRDYVFNRNWTRFTVKRRQISFAWGPRGGGDLTHAAAMEISITAGGGGKGTVWIDDLTLTPKPPVSLHPPRPRATASVTAAGSLPGNAMDGNPKTVWQSGHTTSADLTLDLGAEREFGGLTVTWDSSARARSYDVQTSDDNRAWKTTYSVRGGVGARDALYLPESEARWVRLVLGSSNGSGFAVREVALMPLEWSSTLNAFYFAAAKHAKRGDYPRSFTDSVQTYWTVMGAPVSRRTALMGEDGAVEIGKGRLSLVPSIHDGTRLLTWADARTSQSMVQGDLPIPSVTWALADAAGQLALTTTAFVAGKGDTEALYVRYRVFNRGTERRNVTLFVALRPFQVNGPFQFLNTPGGAAIVRGIRYVHGTVYATEAASAHEQPIVSLTLPSSFGASSFDAGGVMRDLRTGHAPPAASAVDSIGRADAALSYALNLRGGDTADVVIAVPFARSTSLRPMRADSAAATVAIALATTAAEWASIVDRVKLHMPAEASWIARTLRSQQAYILINQDGPRIQPGSRSYARSWIRDGALTSEALLRTGHADRVAAFLDWYAPFQYASGKAPCCVDARGADPVPEHDSDGEFLYLIHQLYRYTGDSSRLASMWPHVQLAVSYLDSLRHIERVPANKATGTLQYYGLLPPSISHEGYSAKPMHSYWDDFWALRGFRDAASIAVALGKPDSARYSAIASEFETDLLASISASMLAHGIDYIPGAADLGDFDATSTTIALEPGGELARLPERALRNTFDRYWQNAEARITGRDKWKDYTPYELRTVGTFIRLGQPERAHALLHFFHSSQRPEAWNEWAEVVRRDPRTPGFIGDMPHTWVGSDFIRSALDIFAYERERDSALVVGAGIPESWARDRDGVGIDSLRTPYGLLSVNENARGNVVHVDVAGLTTIPRGGIVVRAPFPFRAAGATVNGVKTIVADESVSVTSLPARIEFLR